MECAYKNLKSELYQELLNILSYWKLNTIDVEHGGFLGKRDFYNKVVPKANKGIILNSRILWSFSYASNYLKHKDYLNICERSYNYIKAYFKDNTYGGVFWEADYKGNPINRKKQIYAQSFTIYALSEYYKLTKNENAKNWAIEIFKLLEKHARDKNDGGYFEAFNEDWSPIKDMRLSDKDMNASKTMNTHLHVLEAYTSLLSIYKNDELKSALESLVHLFQNTFLNTNHHYQLFFNDQWELLSNSVSYGHDIECAWLVIDAARALNDNDLIKATEATAIKVADTFLKEGINKDGAVFNEKNLDTNHTDNDLHWWPQVEALIGLDYAYQLSGKESYIHKSLQIWEFTKKHLIDKENGEWHFRVDKNGKPYIIEDKVSMWKAPYHTSRACIKLNSEL